MRRMGHQCRVPILQQEVGSVTDPDPPRDVDWHNWSPNWYYLINLGYDIVRCPGNQETASRHLKAIRQEHAEFFKQATGKEPDTVPWLIGVYREYTEFEAKTMPASYGYTPTLEGNIDTPRNCWTRIGEMK